MEVLDFLLVFPNEETCKEHLKNERLKHGIKCRRCGEKQRHYWLSSVEKFQCVVCRSRTNLRSGTVFEKSKIPLFTWYKIIHLMTSQKISRSAKQMQRDTKLKHYSTVWFAAQRLRAAMGKVEQQRLLSNEIEADEAFVETMMIDRENQTFKRGRGSERQEMVMVMVESKPAIQEIRNKKNRIMGLAKMQVIDNGSVETLNKNVAKNVKKETIINTDKWRGYNKLNEIGMNHKPQVVKSKDAMKLLPWAHTLISNFKNDVRGVHHGLSKNHLQNYLNEFCYRLNTRNVKDIDPLFALANLAAKDKWY